MPSSTAARVACMASSTRAFFSFHLGLGGCADLDHGNAADQLGKTLLELLAVVIAGGLLDLGADLLDATGDVFVLPPPSTMVVLSLSMVTRLAVPRSSILTPSSLMPRSSVIALPPVRMAMSCSIALRRSPKPGALTAATFSVPRSLLTTRVASASPSTSSAMMTRGLAVRAICSSRGAGPSSRRSSSRR